MVQDFFSSDPVNNAASLLERLRIANPRVHCITNVAAQVFTANLLLAASAIPSLTYAAEEVPYFVEKSASLLINLGTLDAERRASIPVAVNAAKTLEKPWILDPVFVEASPPRLARARELMAQSPRIMRCNASEWAALTECSFEPDTVSDFARTQKIVTALTGATDHVSDGARMMKIDNGHAVMRQTTAMGCAGTALIAALASVEDDALMAAGCGLLILGVTGEIAASRAQGPGSFVPAFLDTLAALTPDMLAKTARVTLTTTEHARVTG